MKNMDRTFLLFTRKRGFFLGKEASHFAYDHISAPFISQWRREKLRQQLLHIDALKFVFSKKATKLSIWHLLQNVKSTVKISSIFVAFLENMNFNQETLTDFYGNEAKKKSKWPTQKNWDFQNRQFLKNFRENFMDWSLD